MSWRVAKAAVKLREQYYALYPKRSRLSDGTIGDQAHKGTPSDHNPNKDGVVTAIDFTHDPANGFDIAVESQRLVDSGDERIKYIIANSRIWEPGKGWRAYAGTNPHTKHMHLSLNARNCDDTREWDIAPKGDGMKADIGIVTQMATLIGGRGLPGMAAAPKGDDGDLKAKVGLDAGQLFKDWYWSKEGEAFRKKQQEVFAFYEKHKNTPPVDPAVLKLAEAIRELK